MEKYPEYIVGIDLSGDPTAGDSFLELLEMSRKVGLRITAHCAEVSYLFSNKLSLHIYNSV